MAGNRMALFIFCVLLSDHIQDGKSVIHNTNEPNFDIDLQGILTKYVSSDCKDGILANVHSHNTEEWCNKFKMYTSVLAETNTCENQELNVVQTNVCDHTYADSTTTVKTSASSPQTTINIQTTDSTNDLHTVEPNPGLSGTPTSTHDSTQTDGLVMTTVKQGDAINFKTNQNITAAVSTTARKIPAVSTPITSKIQTTESPNGVVTTEPNLGSTVTTNLGLSGSSNPGLSGTTNPGLPSTPKFERNSTQTYDLLTPTVHLKMTNTTTTTQVKATQRPCVFCGSCRNYSPGWLFLIVLLNLVMLGQLDTNIENL